MSGRLVTPVEIDRPADTGARSRFTWRRAVAQFGTLFSVFSALIVMKVFLARALIFGDAGISNDLMWREAAFVVFALACLEFVFRGDPRAYALFDLLASVLLAVTVVFSSFYGRLPSPDALSLVGQAGTVHESIVALLRPGLLLFFADLALLIIASAARRRLPSPRPLRARLLLFLLGASWVLCGLLLSPVLSGTGADDLLTARKFGLVGHQLALFTDPTTAEASVMDVNDPDALQARIEALRGDAPVRGVRFTGSAEGRDLIVIQVESLQAFAVGLSVEGEPVTPNLDRLAADSFVFGNVFQQVGAGNTSDAEFIADTGLYPLDTKAVATTYGGKQFPGMPRLLREAGYEAVTFHTDDVTYWNRDELYPALGYSEYFDSGFFGDEDIAGIGPSDDVLFRKAEPVLRTRFQAGRPFYARFMTMTGHHPFRLSPKRRTLRLPTEYRNTLVGDYLTAMHYTDAAIGRFIERLKADEIYGRSVIVVTGDHAGLLEGTLGPVDRRLLRGLLGHGYGAVDRLRLPLLIGVPGVAHGERSDVAAGQVDLMPTLMNLLGVPLEGQVRFGTDLLNTSTNLVGIRFYMPSGTFVRDGAMFIPGIGFDDGQVLRVRRGRMPSFAQLRDDYDRVLQIERLADSYLGALPERSGHRER